jgi:hypothetical protein
MQHPNPKELPPITPVKIYNRIKNKRIRKIKNKNKINRLSRKKISSNPMIILRIKVVC